MHKLTVPIIITILVTLTACQPDPRKEAKAEEIRMQAQQDALDQAQQRKQDQEMHELQLRQAEVLTQRKEQTASEIAAGSINMIRWSFLFLTAALCFVIFNAARTITKTLQGIGAATVELAHNRANMIHMDENGNFPAMITRIGNGRYALTDINTHTTMELDVRNEPDAQMVAAAYATRQAYVLAAQASKATGGAISAVGIEPQPVHQQIIDFEDIKSMVESER